MTAALDRGDVAAACACHAEDAQLLTPAVGLIEGRQTIEEHRGTGIPLGLSSVTLEAWRVERLGAPQVEIGRYGVDPSAAPTSCSTDEPSTPHGNEPSTSSNPDESHGSSPHPQGGTR